MISKWVHLSFEQRVLAWLTGWCCMFDGLITVLSLGFLVGNLEMKLISYRYLRQLKLGRKIDV